MNENIEDNNYEADNIDEKNHKNFKYDGTQILILLQIIVCTIIVLLIFALKSLSPNTFDIVSDWYKEKLNDSLIIDNSIDGYRETLSRIINYNSLDNKFDLTKSCIVTNGKSNCPLCLTTSMSAPVTNGLISSRFGNRELNGENKMHYGLDIAAEEGEPIYPVLAGKVKSTGEDESYGKYIILEHGNDINTLYAHCSSLNVNNGDDAPLGKPIAFVGSTGESTGSHLHIELRVSGENFDPEPLLKGLYNDV